MLHVVASHAPATTGKAPSPRKRPGTPLPRPAGHHPPRTCHNLQHWKNGPGHTNPRRSLTVNKALRRLDRHRGNRRAGQRGPAREQRSCGNWRRVDCETVVRVGGVLPGLDARGRRCCSRALVFQTDPEGKPSAVWAAAKDGWTACTPQITGSTFSAVTTRWSVRCPREQAREQRSCENWR